MAEEIEEIEVEVRPQEPPQNNALPALDMLRTVLLAGIGAIAVTRDEADAFVKRLVEKGELAQRDGERVLSEVTSRMRAPTQLRAEAQAQVESGLEQLLGRLNIPSKRDIDDLSAKIAQLAARLEEVRQGKG
jgi:poly(hydroxyalkanoate) granule-associated protein